MFDKYNNKILLMWLIMNIVIFGVGVLVDTYDVNVGSIIMSVGAFFIVLLSAELLIRINE